MKNLICVVLALASINSLSACSGKAPNNAAYPNYTAQQNTMTNQMASSNQQMPLGVVNQQQQSYAINTKPTNTVAIPGSRTYDSSIFNKPSSGQTNTVAKPIAPKPTSNLRAPVQAKPQAVPQVSAAQDLLIKAKQRFESLNSFKINVEAFETLIGKTPSRLSFNMFANNGSAKIEVLKHTNSLYVGVKMGYQSGTDSITVRPGGALGFVKVDTKMSDERLSTPRGYRLDQIDAFAISQRLLTGAQQPKVLGKTQINGRTVAILEFTNANTYDQRITRELLGIDMEDHFIRIHEMYEGSTLVLSLKLSNIQLNVPVTASEMDV